MVFWVLVFTFLLGFSAKSQVAFDDYYQERSLFFENVTDTEEPETYPKKFARIQYFHEDRACSDQSSEMTLMPITGEVVDIPLPFPSSKRRAPSENPEFHIPPFLKVFPNPANDVVNLLFKAPDPTTRCRFILEDNQGRRILELNDIRNGIAEFSVDRLPGGMYFGHLIFDNTVMATEKITVVR